MGNGNSALVDGDRRLCQWGPGLRLIDNLIFCNIVRGLILPAQGEDFPPGPTWRQFVSIPPLCKAQGCTVHDVFARKYMCEKLTKCPNFYMIFARKYFSDCIF